METKEISLYFSTPLGKPFSYIHASVKESDVFLSQGIGDDDNSLSLYFDVRALSILNVPG